MRLFYITDIFPSLSQIFISREIAALEALGAEVAVMSFQSDKPAHAGHALDRQLRARRFQGLEDEYGKWEKVRHHMNAFIAYPGGYVDVMKTDTPVATSFVKRFYFAEGGRGCSLTFEAREDVFPRSSRWADYIASTLRLGTEGAAK